MKKTNAARILDRLKINYELIEYEVNESDLSAIHLAETAGIPIEKVFKTLVLEGDKNGNFVCIIPGDKEICGDLIAYPNPVQKGYDGDIAVKGVIANGTIKITDVSGGLVFEGRALGSQAVWNGKNLKGEKVQSGVYVVYSADVTGQFHCTTKLMIYR